MKTLNRYNLTALVVLVALGGCSTVPDAVPPEWNPSELEPKTITMRFMAREDWFAYQRGRKDCGGHDCDFVIGYVAGTAEWDDRTCTISFPAYRGLPSNRVIVHEIRHCYQGSHNEWR